MNEQIAQKNGDNKQFPKPYFESKNKNISKNLNQSDNSCLYSPKTKI